MRKHEQIDKMTCLKKWMQIDRTTLLFPRQTRGNLNACLCFENIHLHWWLSFWFLYGMQFHTHVHLVPRAGNELYEYGGNRKFPNAFSSGYPPSPPTLSLENTVVKSNVDMHRVKGMFTASPIPLSDFTIGIFWKFYGNLFLSASHERVITCPLWKMHHPLPKVVLLKNAWW